MTLLVDVARENHRPSPRSLDQALCLAGVIVLVQIGDGNVGDLSREGKGDGAADARVAAGDQGGSPFQSRVPALTLLAMICGGGQSGFGPRRILRVGGVRRLGPNVFRVRLIGTITGI